MNNARLNYIKSQLNKSADKIIKIYSNHQLSAEEKANQQSAILKELYAIPEVSASSGMSESDFVSSLTKKHTNEIAMEIISKVSIHLATTKPNENLDTNNLLTSADTIEVGGYEQFETTDDNGSITKIEVPKISKVSKQTVNAEALLELLDKQNKKIQELETLFSENQNVQYQDGNIDEIVQSKVVDMLFDAVNGDGNVKYLDSNNVLKTADLTALIGRYYYSKEYNTMFDELLNEFLDRNGITYSERKVSVPTRALNGGTQYVERTILEPKTTALASELAKSLIHHGIQFTDGSGVNALESFTNKLKEEYKTKTSEWISTNKAENVTTKDREQFVKFFESLVDNTNKDFFTNDMVAAYASPQFGSERPIPSYTPIEVVLNTPQNVIPQVEAFKDALNTINTPKQPSIAFPGVQQPNVQLGTQYNNQQLPNSQEPIPTGTYSAQPVGQEAPRGLDGINRLLGITQ